MTGTEAAQKARSGGEEAETRTSSGERPATTPPEAHDTERPGGTPSFRARQHTLIGVAPAAPIVSGRPSQPFDDASELPGVAPAQQPPVSELRPRQERAAETGAPSIDASPLQGPKHTLDAISIAETPILVKRRSRTTAIIVTLVAAIAVVICVLLLGRRIARRADVPAAPTTPQAITSVSLPAEPPLMPPASTTEAPSSPADPGRDGKRRASRQTTEAQAPEGEPDVVAQQVTCDGDDEALSEGERGRGAGLRGAPPPLALRHDRFELRARELVCGAGRA